VGFLSSTDNPRPFVPQTFSAHIESVITDLSTSPCKNVRLYVPVEKCFVYENNKLI